MIARSGTDEARPPRARTRPLASRVAFGFSTGIGLGVALGALAWLSDQLAYPWGAIIPANGIGAWVALGFVLGASARTVPTGALRGVIGLLSAVVAYYLLISVFGSGIRVVGATHAATTWGAVALVVGPVLGAAGGAWRHWRGWFRVTAVAMLAAALIAEGVVLGGLRLGDAGGVVLTIQTGIGALLPLVLLRPRDRLAGYAVLAVMTLVAGVTLQPVITFVRGIADRF
jgi:hypothetical protein